MPAKKHGLRTKRDKSLEFPVASIATIDLPHHHTVFPEILRNDLCTRLAVTASHACSSPRQSIRVLDLPLLPPPPTSSSYGCTSKTSRDLSASGEGYLVKNNGQLAARLVTAEPGNGVHRGQ